MAEQRDGGGRRAREGRPAGAGLGPTLTRRGFFETLTMLGLGLAAFPTHDALAWDSWSKGTSEVLKSASLGDCMHEDITQIAYACAVQAHKENKNLDSLINPWAGKLSADKKTATVSNDTVAAPGGAFADEKDLAGKLYRDTLACLRIGSFWSDAAANAVQDLGDSITEAKNVPKFSGSNRYEGAWDVAAHVSETQERNAGTQRRSLVQFAHNERANFMHGMLSTTADGKTYLKQGDIKTFIYQWMGVAYEYARTGQVKGVGGVGDDQAQLIIDGLVDPYGQEDRNKHDLCTTLKVGDDEASKKISSRQKRLRALGMLCHTMEDLWNPAHTCRVYREPRWDQWQYDYEPYTIMAFANYRKQNGTASPANGYHMPYDRYSNSDGENRGKGDRANDVRASEHLGGAASDRTFDPNAPGRVLDYCTLGMDEAIHFTRELLNRFFDNKPWDGGDGVGDWVRNEVLRDCFNDGNSIICDAGRRCLYSPTYIIAPVQDMKAAFHKVKLEKRFDDMLRFARQFDEYQRHAISFFVTDGGYMEEQTKYVNRVTRDYQDDWGAERSIHGLVNQFYEGVYYMRDDDRDTFFQLLGANGCQKAISLLGTLRGLVQEFSIDLRLSKNPNSTVVDHIRFLTETLRNAAKKMSDGPKPQASVASSLLGLVAPREALADETDETYVTTDAEVLDLVSYDDGSCQVSVRDLGALGSAVMEVPRSTPGRDLLQPGAANLSISYTVETECEDDINFTYTVTKVENPNDDLPLSRVVGTVTNVSEGILAISSADDEDELFLTVGSDAGELPSVGDYVCAYYARDASGTERLLDYVVLDKPQDVHVVEYPVVRVYGSGMWLLNTEAMSTDYEGDGVAGGRDCDDNLIYVEFGNADISPVPQEGCMATVHYYDKGYYEDDGTLPDPSGEEHAVETDRDGLTSASPVRDTEQSQGMPVGYDAYEQQQAGPALAAASSAPKAEEPEVADPAEAEKATQAEGIEQQEDVPARDETAHAEPQTGDAAQLGAAYVPQANVQPQDDINDIDYDMYEYGDGDYDSLDYPAYETDPDDYWSLGSGSEARHIATSVQGSSEWADGDLLLMLYGGLLGEIRHADDSKDSSGSGGSVEPTKFNYASNGDGSHRKYVNDPKNFKVEMCTYDSKGTCIYCGHVHKAQSDTVPSSGTDLYWPRTFYPQAMGYTGWTPSRRTYRSSDPWYSSSNSSSSTSSTSSTTSTPAAGGLTGGYTGSGAYATPATGAVASPAAGVASTGAVTAPVAGTAATPVAGTAATPVAVLPNTADVAAGLDAIMYAAAAAGAALTARGLKGSSERRDSEKDESSEEQDA